MYYVDQPPTTPAPVAAEALPPAGTDVFTLHSRPTAHTRIYLDFDGTEVSNTGWNDATDQTVGAPAQVYAGYSSDGDPSTFSAAERDVIARTWAEVAEDYAPFQVDVTTQDPGDAKLRRSSTSDADYGMRVLVTGAAPSTTALCQACSGIAYVIGRATPGAAGGRVTATARWSAAASGGSPVTAYKVVALRMNTTGRVVRRTGFTAAASARAKVVRLPKGRYRFTVAAVNRIGTGRTSARSGLVAAR